MEDVPFDLRALRIIVFDKNAPNWGEILKNDIKKAIKEIIKSPKKSVLPTFLELKEEEKAKPISKSAKDILKLEQEINTLRREMRRTNLPRRAPAFSFNLRIDEILNDAIRRNLPADVLMRSLEVSGYHPDDINQIIKAYKEISPAQDLTG